MKTDCIHYEICKEAKWCNHRNNNRECEYYLPLNASTAHVIVNAADYYVAEVLNEMLPHEKLKSIKKAAELNCSPLGAVIFMARTLWNLRQLQEGESN